MMSWRLKTPSLPPIGLDIGHNSVKMIQLAMKGGHISIIAAGEARIEADIKGDGGRRRKSIISAVRQMLAAGSFRGRNVVSSLSNDELKITNLRLAEMGTGEMEQTLREEVGRRFGLDPDRDVIHYLIAGNVQDGRKSRNELILFAAADETVKSHIAMLEDAQLRPVAIDTVPCALFRSFERLLRREQDSGQTSVFVDVGSRFTTVVFECGGEISLTKQIPIGGERFNREVASKLAVNISEAEILRKKLREPSEINDRVLTKHEGKKDLTNLGRSSLDASIRQLITDAVGAAAEELTRKIALCFRYYTVAFRGRRIERAILSGAEAYEDILLNVLRRHLTVEVEVAQPLRGLDMTNVNFDSDGRSLLCDWAVAVGLGLKGWSRGRSNYERN